MADLPSIAAGTYSTSFYNPEPDVNVFGEALPLPPANLAAGAMRRGKAAFPRPPLLQLEPEELPMPVETRRLVQVVIADPDRRVRPEIALIYQGPAMFTDATDQELFFELDIMSKLAAYNNERTKIPDKTLSTKDREVFLEPAKIRDLKMIVVNIATF